jgi:hypothetical protein
VKEDEERAGRTCGSRSEFWNCPSGGVLFWLSRPKKEPKKLGFLAWPLRSLA